MKAWLKDFRVGWRWLVKESAWSALVVAGLAIGFASCFLLLGYVRFSMQYNQHLVERERVYQLKTRFNLPEMDKQWSSLAPFPAVQALRDGALADKASIAWDYELPVRVASTVSTQHVLLVDPDFAELLELKLVAGDLGAALTRPDSVALTEEKAVQLFGTANAVGKRFSINRQNFQVAAVLATPPQTSTQPYAMLSGRNFSALDAGRRHEMLDNWGSMGGKVYFRPRPGLSAEQAVSRLQQAFDRSPFSRALPAGFGQMLGGRPLASFASNSLADVYFDPDLRDGPMDMGAHGSLTQVWGLAAIGVLILLLAAINYVNLATVRTVRRQREIGVRKVLGAGVGRVAGQFLAESVLVALLAVLLGLLLAWLLLPAFGYLMERELGGVFSVGSVLTALAAAVLVGGLAGAYPAWVAARVRATQALAGRDQQETRHGIWLRRGLTVLQFATAMGLSGVTLAIAWQTWHGSRLDPGFAVDGVLTIEAGDNNPRDQAARAALRTALAALPGVRGAALSGNNLVDGMMRMSTFKRADRGSVNLEVRLVGCDYLQTYGVKLLAGRLLPACANGADQAGGGWVLSAAAARELGFATPQQAVGRTLNNASGQAMPVLGVVSDVRLQSARERPRSWLYQLGHSSINIVSLRFGGDEAALRAGIARLWPRYFPDYPLEMKSARYQLDQRYSGDIKLAQLLAAAAGVSILIAGFGIYVLSAYSVQRMTREVVLRKLHGADGGAIVRLVGREFLLVLLVGAAIGLLPAWLYIRQYLADFVERAPIGGWTLLLSLLLCMLVAVLAVWRHLLTALRLRPVLALRA
ncbi:ABC transporter permease [Chromobacterium sp. CV08]|uniref:ABC transporter permease n=1 Tax=Chromobacterium sp. CV08 TaxID=3133274 RepID=UPI003DA97638